MRFVFGRYEVVNADPGDIGSHNGGAQCLIVSSIGSAIVDS